MRLPKESLAVRHAASKDDPRYSIQGIMLEPSGRTTATDGHMLARFMPKPSEVDGSEMPLIAGVNNTPLAAPVILDAAPLADVVKAIPRKSIFSCCLGMLIDGAAVNGTAPIGVNDRDLENARTFQIKTLEASFPKVDAVIPATAPESEGSFGIGLLERALKIAKETGATMVRIGLYGPEKAAVIGATSERGELLVLVMPMRDETTVRERIEAASKVAA